MNGLPLVGACWLVIVVPVRATAQTPAERVANARHYVAAGQLDSARSLLVSATDSVAKAPPATRAEAFILLGLVEHLRGVDSLARLAFRHALAVDSALKVAGLAAIAPGAATLFEEERCAAWWRGAGGLTSTIPEPCHFVRAEIEERPTLLRGPRLRNPTPAVTGRVLVQAIVDTTGRADPKTIRVVRGVYPTLDSVAVDYVRRARFRPGRVAGRAVRVLVSVPVDFKLGDDPYYAVPELAPRRRGPSGP